MAEGPAPARWCPEEAEDLVRSLPGVLSARVIASPEGAVQEVHVLSNTDLSPKQTVRNVESAFAAHFQVDLDHRKVSVARVEDPPMPANQQLSESVVSLVVDDEDQPDPASVDRDTAPEAATVQSEGRILYESHRNETEQGNRVRVSVLLSYRGEEHEGSAVSANLPRARMEAAANATLRAVEAVAASQREDSDGAPMVALALDGVKVVSAFDRDFSLVAVHALAGRDIVALAGASVVHDRADAAVIMSTLQATDRWVRGRID